MSTPNGVSDTHGQDANQNNIVNPADANGAPLAANTQVIASTSNVVTIPTASAAIQAPPTGSTSTSSSVFGLPMDDFLYQSGIAPLPETMYLDNQLKVGLGTLGLAQVGGQVVNDSSNGESSILINSDRVIINSKTAHTIIAGAEGVALTSLNKVNIDADESVTIFGANGVFLGVPNKGAQPKTGIPDGIKNAPKGAFTTPDGKKLKSYPSPDVPYEPVVLGLKLVNWLEDLLVILKNLQILTNTGLATPREDGQWDLIAMQARLPELISNYIFVDGYSHDEMDYKSVDPAPTADTVTKPKTSINVNVNLTATGLPGSALTPTTPTGPNTAKPKYGESSGEIANLNTQ